MNSPLAVDALNIWPSAFLCRMNSGGSLSSRKGNGGDRLAAGGILPTLAFSGPLSRRLPDRTGTRGTADEERRPAATPPIKKVSRKFSHNDKQEGGYFQLTTDTFTVASY